MDKEQNTLASLTLREHPLPTGPRETQFIASIRKIYYDKSNPIYGVFDTNQISHPFQSMLSQYLEGHHDFVSFTKNAVRHLITVANRATQSTGGYILFAHYEENEDFLLTVMLNSKMQYNINDDLIIQEISSLDTDRLDVANAVNITRWIEREETYLSFAKGRKEVSNYFLSFIGCTNQTSAKSSSELFKKAVLDFLETRGIEQTEREDIRNQIFQYCNDQIKRKEPIHLHHVSSILDQNEPTLFQEFASSETYQVSAMVQGHSPTLKSLKYYSYRSKKLKIEFDSSLLFDETIIYHEERNELLIKRIPDELKQQLQRGQ